MAAIWQRQKSCTSPSLLWQDAGDLSLVSPDDLGIKLIDKSVTEVVAYMVHQATLQGRDESFALFDMGLVIDRYKLWMKCFPDIQPFYAVKAYDDPAVVNLLTYLGAGLDCASKTEIQLALKAGAKPSNIIYSNTIKFPSHIKLAADEGINLMTYDSKEELVKIKQIIPSARLILRICSQKHEKGQLPTDRFGCDLKNAAQLLQDAQCLGFKVVGVSFHAGSGIKDPEAYTINIKAARKVFDVAQDLGINMSILDIGGGFFGDIGAEVWLKEMSGPINSTINSVFPKESGVTVISEPGRYFVEGALTLLACVIGKKIKETPAEVLVKDQIVKRQQDDKTDATSFEYVISESVFGMLTLHHYAPDYEFKIKPVIERPDGAHKYISKVCGPSCASPDVVKDCCHLPELQIGEWLMIPNLGHYGVSLSSTFNGIPFCPITRVMHKDTFTYMSAEFKKC